MDLLVSSANRLRESSVIQRIKASFSISRTMSTPEVSWPVPMRAIGAQNLLTMPGGVSTSGYLHKKGGSQFSLMKWPLRYIIIHKGCVYYFKTSTSASPQGAFSLNGYNRVMRATEETTSSNVFPFKIIHFSKKHRTWFLSAASEDERRKWMRYLRREIDYYNDRRDSLIPSDPDSDAESFYGSIERPMDIKHAVENATDEYVEEDDDDEPDYLKPDADNSPTTDYPPSSTGKPVAPHPSYPPPPVPSNLSFHKPPPPPIPAPNRTSPSGTLAYKPPPPAFPPPLCRPQKGQPPPPPPAQKVGMPPPPPPPNGQRRPSSLHNRGPPPTAVLPVPATLPFCKQIQDRLAINTPAHNQGFSPTNARQGTVGGPGGIKPGPPLPPAPNFGGFGAPRPGGTDAAPRAFPHPPPPFHKPVTPPSTLHKPGGSSNRVGPKPPPPTSKPPVPPLPSAKPRSEGTNPGLQRASPEGQSFRSLGDEAKKKPKARRDSDDDYENVHLPESVFFNTTDTGDVEMVFLKCPKSPRDGLYGIRNGTRTSQVLVVWDESLGRARNYRLFEEDETVFLDSDIRFETLDELIEHYYHHTLPKHESLRLQQPYLPYIPHCVQPR